jgi:hypothetical protein
VIGPSGELVPLAFRWPDDQIARSPDLGSHDFKRAGTRIPCWRPAGHRPGVDISTNGDVLDCLPASRPRTNDRVSNFAALCVGRQPGTVEAGTRCGAEALGTIQRVELQRPGGLTGDRWLHGIIPGLDNAKNLAAEDSYQGIALAMPLVHPRKAPLVAAIQISIHP